MTNGKITLPAAPAHVVTLLHSSPLLTTTRSHHHSVCFSQGEGYWVMPKEWGNDTGMLGDDGTGLRVVNKVGEMGLS